MMAKTRINTRDTSYSLIVDQTSCLGTRQYSAGILKEGFHWNYDSDYIPLIACSLELLLSLSIFIDSLIITETYEGKPT